MDAVLNGPPKDASTDELDAYLKKLASDVTLQSRKDGFFALWLNQVKEHVSGNFVKKFNELKTDEERIAHMWTVQPLHSLKVQRFYKKKDVDISECKRNKGNEFFKKKEYMNALALYSQAIIKAPDGLNLSYAYANRSATLFIMKKYSYCLQDIGLALQHKYPENLHYKILERRASCYQKQGNYSLAQKYFHESLKSLRVAKLEAAMKPSWEKTLNGRIAECGGREDVDLNPEPDEKAPYVGGPAPENDLFEGQNPTMLNASSAIGIKSTYDKGRHAVALRDIPAGEVVIADDPHVSVLMPEKHGGHCMNCAFKLTAPIGCSNCSGIAFCSIKCREESGHYHKVECEFSDLLYASGMSLNCYIALRMISSKPINYFKKIRKDLNPNPVIPTEKDPLDPKNYACVYNLVSLDSDRDPLDFLQRTLMAIFLLKVLQRAHYFGPYDDDEPMNADLTEDETFIGSLLLRNLQVVQFNAHELSSTVYYSKSKTSLPFKYCKSMYMGLAVYPTAALLNHSCMPNVSRTFEVRKMILRSIRPIKKGEILDENYGPVFTHHPLQERQVKMISRYWFKCACEPCFKSWPTYVEMKQPMSFLCTNCRGELPMDSCKLRQDSKMVFKCKKCDSEFKASSYIEALDEMQKCQKEGRKYFDQGNREGAICQFLRYSELASQIICLPYKEFHLVQDALRILLICRGTSYYMEQPPKK